MLKPIDNICKTFCSKKKSATQEKVYQDPLLKWPLRGAAFTNEVGEALRPLIGEYATLSWIPALLYFGADIYDKYKNNDNEYSPNSVRGIKEATFQGLASILFPLAAVKAGQGLFSYIGLATKDKITISSQEHVASLANDFIANGRMHKYKNDEKACLEDFLGVVSHNIDYKNSKNPFKRLVKKTEEFLLPGFKTKNDKNIKEYAENTIKDLIATRKNLLSPTEEFKKNVWYDGFKKAKENGQTTNVAVKTILTKYQNNKMLKSKSIKTIGGFVALFALVKPIDNFVEHVLIEKLLTPILDKKRDPA